MARPKISSPAASAEPTPAPALAPTPEAPQPTHEPVAVLAAAATPVPPDGLEGIVCSKPWPCDQAIAVASCESGLDRNGRLDGNWATNGNNYGLFQINGIHADLWPDFDASWMDPVKNTEWAFEIWSANGWRPWSCQP
jgi:Lysozyme like domain